MCVLCGRIYEIKRERNLILMLFICKFLSLKMRKFFISKLIKEALAIRTLSIVYLSKFNEPHIKISISNQFMLYYHPQNASNKKISKVHFVGELTSIKIQFEPLRDLNFIAWTSMISIKLILMLDKLTKHFYDETL